VVILKFSADREQLLQQAAMINSLDFKLTRDVDSGIRKLQEHQQFFRALTQASNFFSTTVISLISTLRLLLIPSIKKSISTFEAISTISFTHADDVEPFIVSIMKAAKDLADTNRQLVEIHRKFISDIASLFDCSLITKTGKATWKESV
jgi:hypothetical protein